MTTPRQDFEDSLDYVERQELINSTVHPLTGEFLFPEDGSSDDGYDEDIDDDLYDPTYR
jgi:hypothetical protein